MTDDFVPVGRHVFNVWRVMRADRSLTSYSFESVSFLIMHRRWAKFSKPLATALLTDTWRYPFFDRATLTDWCRSAEPQLLQRIIYYLVDRTLGSLKILEDCEIVTKVA
jgi:DNA polymerase zeta